MTKKSRQKVKYLENEKSFWDEIKNIFHLFETAFNEANKTFFFGRWGFDFNKIEFLVFMFWSIKYVYNIYYQMYL